MFNPISESHAKAMLIKVLEHYKKTIPEKRMPVKSYGDELFTAEELLEEVNNNSPIGQHLIWESVVEIIEKDIEQMEEDGISFELN